MNSASCAGYLCSTWTDCGTGGRAASLVLSTTAVAREEKSEQILKKEPKGAVDVLVFEERRQGPAGRRRRRRIGGRVNPWIKGTAAFPIVDRSLKPCNEIAGDTCKTPWDYLLRSRFAQGDAARACSSTTTASSSRRTPASCST